MMRPQNKQKPKYYKNTHGTVYRLGTTKKPKRKKIQQQKAQKEA